MRRFWNFTSSSDEESILRIDGYIAEESWLGDEVTPKQFEAELSAVTGDLTVWINSGGGDCFAASQIYTMLMEHKSKRKCKVSVKVDGIAASAASVIAMSGDEVLMSPTSLLMIHNPASLIFGEVSDLERGIEMLNEVKESIINAYTLKTKQSRAKISHLMDNETWFNAKKATDMGFADGMLYDDTGAVMSDDSASFMWNSAHMVRSVVAAMRKTLPQKKPPAPTGISIYSLDKRLNLIKP